MSDLLEGSLKERNMMEKMLTVWQAVLEFGPQNSQWTFCWPWLACNWSGSIWSVVRQLQINTGVINDPLGQLRSPSRKWISLDFEVLGRTDERVKIVITTGRDCSRLRGSTYWMQMVPRILQYRAYFLNKSKKWNRNTFSHYVKIMLSLIIIVFPQLFRL